MHLRGAIPAPRAACRHRSEEHTSELQSRLHLVCRLLLEKKKSRPAEQSQIAIRVHTHHHPLGDAPREPSAPPPSLADGPHAFEPLIDRTHDAADEEPLAI